MQLYPHNQYAYEAVMKHYSEGNRKAAVVHATGTGKSYIIAAVAENFNKVLVVAPNNFVLDETRKICNAGCEFRTYASVMYDQGNENEYDLIVLDEFHRSGAEKWGQGIQSLLAANPNAKLLGTSATHIRYLDDARNMADEIFDGNVVSYLPLRTAIEQGILPEPIYVSSVYSLHDDTEKRTKRIMECSKSEEWKAGNIRQLKGISNNWDNADGVPRIIKKYFDKDVQRIIVFCAKVNKASSARKWLGKWFGLAGFQKIRFYNIDYKEQRLEQEMADFQKPCEDGQLKVAISVNMLNEGVHIPRVDGVIMLRSTISRIIIEQQIGRCLTTNNRHRTPVVLDLVNNMDSIKYDECLFSGEWNGKNKSSESQEGNGFPFKVIDECRDIRIFLQQLDQEIRDTFPFGWWTKEHCIEEARKYNRVCDWRKCGNGSYDIACKNGWLSECSAHMERSKKHNGYWTKERCLECARKYNSIKEWSGSDNRSYDAAKKHKWLDECTSHMTCSGRRNYWTLERCKSEAIKYESTSEWKKKDITSYNAAKKHKWLEQCNCHMKKKVRHFTFELCIEEAREYSYLSQWRKTYSYVVARRNGWIEECSKHMIDDALKPAGYWTREKCIEDARKYKTRTEWARNSSAAYTISKRIGCFDECVSHMPDKRNHKK